MTRPTHVPDLDQYSRGTSQFRGSTAESGGTPLRPGVLFFVSGVGTGSIGIGGGVGLVRVKRFMVSVVVGGGAGGGGGPARYGGITWLGSRI